MKFNRNGKVSHFLFMSIINKQQTPSQHKFYVFVLVLYGPVFSNLEEARKTFNCLKLCRGKSPSKNVFIIVTFLRIMPHNWHHLMYVDILIYNLPFCLRSRVVSASIAQPGSDTRYSTVRLPESL